MRNCPLRGLALVFALGAAADAQAPAPWSDLPVASASPASLAATGLIVLYRGAATVQAFSAATGRWHALAVSFGTTPQLQKEIALVPESDRWTAFSAWRGKYEPLLVPLAQTTMTATDSLAFVSHAGMLHTFSAFTGLWHSRTMPTGWVLHSGPRIAVLSTPASASSAAASAFDAFTGTWHDMPVQPVGIANVSVAGCSAVVSTPQLEFGFSALRPGWVPSAVSSVGPFPAISVSYQAGDLAAGLGSIFSGLTGTFTPSPFALGAGSFILTGNVAAGSAGGQHMALGAASNTWVPLFSQPWSPYLDANCVLGYGNGTRTAFSQHHDATSTHVGQNGVIRGNVATVDVAAFSSLTGQWYPAPAGATPAPRVGHNSVTWSTPAGIVGWSAFDGGSTLRPGVVVPTSYGFAGHDATDVLAFDALGRRWLAHPRLPGGVYVTETPNIVIAVMPGQAIAYATTGRQLAAQALAEPWTAAFAGERVGYVTTATHIYAFGGLADSAVWQGDPGDGYAAARGTTMRVQARVPANHFVALAFGPHGPGPVATPFGDVWLDPNTAVLVPMAAAPGESRAVMPIAIPNTVALRNTLWLQQAIAVAPSGSVSLGAPSVLHVH